ncbi:YY1-associated factor 2-like [Elysia marginata]|uniref:YY1-associated factor 2-like n=1 Tax=Elysia marginata TaxID=1093978 RepID=A0AAV4JY97_9GAST|nr:YY1-associated factor 2-like [Elysia marginata]
MDEKRSSGRSKRQAKVLDEGFWDCSVCTFKNSPEAYKCEMCDVRKGTSTRKPRINPQLVALQKAQQFQPPPKKEKSHSSKRDKNGEGGSDSQRVIPEQMCAPSKFIKPVEPKKSFPRLKNVDRKNPSHLTVTVGNVTVVMTDFQPKPDSRFSDSHLSSDASDSNSVTAPDLTDDSSRDAAPT